jgi:aminoglycoside phosphotransferase (APT) family kinase protein
VTDPAHDGARVAAWVNRATDVRLDESTATLDRLAGGNSNETYLLGDGHRTLVVRRPPRHTLDASAHSMSREHRVIRALDPTPVPNAPLVGYCDDPSVLGVDYLVSEYLPDSVSLHDVLPEAYEPGAASLEPLGHALVDVLVQVQAVDWRAAGLEGFGRPDGFLERQVPRWEAQYRKHQVRDLADFDRVTAWLAASLPAEQPGAIMHGDFHLDNCLFSAQRPELLAVVDWEMATIGDPLVDLGLCLAFWGPRLVEPLAMPRVQGVSREPGAPTREALAGRYAAASGRDLTHVRWYQAFALWKLAVVIEPAYGQHVRGELDTPYSAALEHDVPALFAEAAAVAGLD